MAKGEMPDLLFVAPIGHGKHKQKHVRCVLMVEEWDANGAPTKCRILRDTEIVDLAKIGAAGIQAHFITGYIPSINFDDHPERANKRIEYPPGAIK